MASRSLRAFARCGARLSHSSRSHAQLNVIRSLTSAATSGAIHKGDQLRDILSSASKAKPLKDAVKFYGESPENTLIWTYHELQTHVNALSSGLRALGYAPGDKIVLWIPPGSPEYATTVLAVANIGVTVVACEAPADPTSVSVSAVVDTLKEQKPKMIIFSHRYQVPGDGPEAGIVASTHSVLNAIAPGVSINDAKGLSGFSPLTGKPFCSAEFPSLRHVVHTGDTHVRGAITFRSLLAYNGDTGKAPPRRTDVLMSAESGQSMSVTSAIDEAVAVGDRLRLTNDHASKNGRLIIPPSASPTSATGMIAALMYEALWISPSPDANTQKLANVSSSENALIMN